MNNYEALNNNNSQNWDMSDVPFAGEKNQQRESLKKALQDAPMLLSESAIFGDTGRTNNFTNTIISKQPNAEILKNIKALDNGRFKESYGVDYSNRGYTGLGQVSGALDYFDKEYGSLIDNNRLSGLIKTCIAISPMRAIMGNFGIREFAKSAKMDDETTQLISMIINNNSMVLAKERFDEGNQESGAKLLEVNKKYLARLHDGLESGYEEREAKCVCNIQKIIMDCEKEGATIAKERKASKR